MPRPFHNAVLTDQGANLLTRSLAGELHVEFTKLAVGSGEYSEPEKSVSELQKRTSLKVLQNRYAFSDVAIHDEHAVKLTALITNQDTVTKEVLVDEGYYINEIGIYAKEKDNADASEVLYSISVTSGDKGDYMPAYNGNSPAQITQDFFAVVGNSGNVVINSVGAALLKDGNASDTIVTFSEAESRENISSGEKLSTLFGKIRKLFADLKTVAFTGSYKNLIDKPEIPTAVAVKGNAETSYRTGNVNLTPANIGAAPTSHASSATTYGVSTAANYGHAMATSTAPKANGTAAVGSETAKFARGDHVHPLQTSVSGSSGSCTGNSATATKLATARTLSLYDADGVNFSSVSFDGSSNVSLKLPAIIKGTLVNNWLHSLYGSTGGMIGAEYANYIRLWSNYYRTNVSASGDNACWVGTPSVDNTSGILYVTYAAAGNASLQPHLDNDVTLGSSGKRYKQLYAATATISTSDRNKKHDISYIGEKNDCDTAMTDEQLEVFIMGLLACIYRLNDSDSERPHHGLIAQDVEELMQKIGLSDHAGFIKSPKTKEITLEKEIEEEIEDPETGEVKIVKRVVKESQLEEVPGEYEYSLRYEEFIADIIRFVQIQKIRADKLEERFAESEKKNAALEKRVETLEKMLIKQ